MENNFIGSVNPEPACTVRGCPLAMAYVPLQRWEALYDAQEGFRQGTIFMALDKPFLGKAGCRG